MSLLDTASLIVTPNAYKEGKLYSVIPSDGSGDMSVVRATTATRVNSAGLVELVPYNLLQRSEEFENAYWAKIGGSISANTTTAPNGTTTADKIIEDSSNGVHHILMPNVTPSGTNTLSVYAKQGERNWVWLYLFDGVAGSLFAWFDVSTGTVGGVNSGLTATIESVGNQWYRCSITRTQGNTGNGGFGITNANNVLSYTGNGTSGAYFWGAQLNEGTILPYQKTETRLNIPRLDYSNGTCPSLLVEPQRTNSCLWSEQFDNAAWVKTNATISANAIASPSGVQDADLLQSSNSTEPRIRQTTTQTGSATFSYSCFAKKGNVNFLILRNIAVNIGGGSRAWFNLDTGVIGTVNSGLTASIESVGNGWYRCNISGITDASPTNLVDISLSATDNSISGSAIGSNIYIWGAQVELGSYSTSYIPTTSASVTRNADAISKTGISSLIGQTEGTMFVDAVFGDAYDTNNLLMTLSDGTVNNLVYINRSNGNAEIVVKVSGVSQVTYNSSILSAGVHKVAIGYKANEFVVYIDGVLAHTDTSGSVPACSKLNIGSYWNNSLPYNNGINAAALWKTRLTNDELERLTGTGFNTYAEMANYYNYITQ